METINKHGVKVRGYRTSYWGHFDKDNVWHNANIQVPECCWPCKFLDSGECGDYGDILSPPSCLKNIWLPTKTNKCVKKENYSTKSKESAHHGGQGDTGK